MNIIRAAYPEDDERLFPAGSYFIEWDVSILYTLVFGFSQRVWVPILTLSGFQQSLTNHLLESMAYTQGVVYDIGAVDRVSWTQKVPYGIRAADSGITTGDYYFDEGHGL